MTKWTWKNVKPGVLALSGTPFQVRIDASEHLIFGNVYKRVFHTYDGADRINTSVYLDTAKMVAENKAGELLELGLVEVDDDGR